MGVVDEAGYRERVYALVQKSPRGRVMTYGQIAAILGDGYTARTVGYVMSGGDENKVPWQRVINAKGMCSTGRLTLPHNMQQAMLESEGVEFDEKGRCDLSRYQWHPEVPVEGSTPKLFVSRKK